MLELGEYSDPQAALLEVQVVDVRGGRGEARVEAVFRQLVEQYRQHIT